MKPILSLSTCWLSHRHQDGYAMLKEMADLGFEWAELSHGIRIPLVPGILRAVEEGVINVSSCHNFCPLPTGVSHAAPNLYVPSSRHPREREQWLRHTKRSIDFANQVKSRLLVLHLGSVEFFWCNPARGVEDYVEAHGGEDLSKDAGYIRRLTRASDKMRERKPPFWDNTRKGLSEVLPYAAAKHVTLGLENREGFDELPLDEDFPAFLASMPADSPAGYWHDTGHAHIKETMQLLNHREHLEKNAPYAVGFHLHDVSDDGRDHQQIGSGKIDFEMVSRFWRPEHTLVIELSPRLAPEEVLASKKQVEALIAARFGR